VYEKDEPTSQTAAQMAGQYVASLKALPADKLAAKKDEARRVRDVFKYLARFKIVPDTFAPKAEIEQIIKGQGWDKKQ
jgi:hypothetical protein